LLVALAGACQGTVGSEGIRPPPGPAAPPPTMTPAPAPPMPAPAPTVTPTPTPPVTPQPDPPVTPPAPAPVTTPPGPVRPPPGEKRIVFVVGNANNVGQGDLDLRTFMEDLGFVVDTADDGESSRTFRDAGLVVISSSAAANQVQDQWDTEQPVLLLSSDVFTEMRLTSGRNAAGQQAARVIDIVAAGHPIASGLSGPITISDRDGQLNFASPGPGATIIATVAGDQKRAVIFAYDVGAQLVPRSGETVRTARNRRVGFFLRQNDFQGLRKDGETLLEAALNWTWSGS
jgi:hypothetical protein